MNRATLASPKPSALPCRAVALDLDGTVLDSHHRVPAEVVEAVSAALQRGIAVALASSRGPNGMRAIQESLGLLHEPFVCFQGALVARWGASGALEVISERTLPNRLARSIEEQALARQLTIGRYTGLEWRVQVRNAVTLRESKLTGERPILSSSSTLDSAGDPHKLLAITHRDAETERLHQLADAFRGQPVAFVFSHHNYLEITAPGVDKGQGLQYLAELFGIPLQEWAAVGDGDNDVAMLRAVGNPIAMGHAPPSVKMAARWSVGTNDEYGVVQALDSIRTVPGTPGSHRSTLRVASAD